MRARKAALAGKATRAKHSAAAAKKSKTAAGKSGRRRRRWRERTGAAGPVPVLDAKALATNGKELSRVRGDSESVDELAEEGQAMEAELLSGVEEADAANADESEVTTREVPEDDVPPEYRDID
ncbi:MAG TPA: hypothetical protein VGS20_06530 [Candidatus Acidoferrales bacterium]|nr:hypothetical protein [Candidatus Acidoferrales bacterium]